MFSIPGRASDAGPAPRRRDPEETLYLCEGCGDTISKSESYRCQGETTDRCLARICESCLTKCTGCGLPVCSSHIERTSDGAQHCHACIAHWRECKGRCGCEPVETLAEAERYEYAMAKGKGDF
jgi:hypothetical protein